MNYNKDNTIILAICGKSATGKDTLAKWIVKNLTTSSLPAHLVISETTRPKRIKEQAGQSYKFISRSLFEKRINTGHYIEYSSFRGWYYGTPIDDINFGAVNIMVVNKQGLKNMLEYRRHFTIIPVYLEVPLNVRLRRSIERENKFRFEYLRRAIADWKTFLGIKKIINKYRYHLTFSTEDCNSWRQGIVVINYLKRILKPCLGNSQ